MSEITYLKYCPYCIHYGGNGACSKKEFNVMLYPEKFENICNAKYFEKIDGVEIDEDEVLSIEAKEAEISKKEIVPLYNSIGGWLILLGINMVLSMLGLSGYILNYISKFNYYFRLYDKYFLVSVSTGLVLLCISFYALMLYNSKSKRFVEVVLLLLVLFIIESIFNYIMVSQNTFSSSNTFVNEYENKLYLQLIPQSIASFIWGWYILVSKRVKGTFVN